MRTLKVSAVTLLGGPGTISTGVAAALAAGPPPA
jgi:hypothetical protein